MCVSSIQNCSECFTIQEDIKKVEVELKEVQAAMAEIESADKSLQKEQIELKHEHEKYDTVVKDNSQKMKHWKKEVRCFF